MDHVHGLLWNCSQLNESTSVVIMARCRSATSHYLNQCWPRPISPFRATRPTSNDKDVHLTDIHTCYEYANRACYSAYSGVTRLHQFMTWWRHQMETFSALLAICAGNSPVSGEFPAQRPVTQSFDIFFDLRLNKRLSKQSWCWWFETLSCPLWRHCNVELLTCINSCT